jgi:4-amino-4-deoxy-L-arabinose transferase-like glycosyltransferase
MKYREDLKFPLVCSAIFFVVASITSLLVFGAIPHVQDSVAQFVHAKAFLSGAVTFESHKYPEFFEIILMMNDENGRWFSQYPPGHIALLAVGHLFGAPWLINPLIGSATVFAAYCLAKDVYGEATAKITALLTMISPFVLFMSAEYMNHSTALLFCTLFVLFFIRAVQTGGRRNAVCAGAALGMMFITRPLSSFGIALPFLVVGFFLLVKNRALLKQFILMAVAFCVFALVQLWFNYMTTGDAFVFGYSVRFGDAVQYGFGKTPWGDPHTLALGIENLSKNIYSLSDYLFSWPISSLVFALLALVFGFKNCYNWLFVSVFCSLALVYVFYFFQDLCFGPRYLYEAAVLLIILTAYGMVRLYECACTLHQKAGIAFVALVYGMCVYGFAFQYPVLFEKYADKYWKVDSHFLVDLDAYELENALVFVSSKYRNVASTNPPQDNANVIYAINKDFYDNTNHNQKLMDYYPNRSVYFESKGMLTRVR